MENPNTWSSDVHAIRAAIDEFHKNIADGVIGLSMAALIELRVVKPLRERIKELENGQ